MRHIILLIVAALILAACGGGTTATPAKATDAPKPAAQPTQAQAVPPTAAPPTAAPKPTDVPKPAPTVAPTQAPAPKATEAPKAAAVGKVGEPVEVNGIRLTVHKVEVKADLGQFTKAKDGRAFVVVEVTVENTGQAQHSANPFNFKLRDADGQSYNQGFGSQDPLQLAQLVKGDKARGSLAFDVKVDAKGLTLIYDTVPLANAAQQIRVDLGQ